MLVAQKNEHEISQRLIELSTNLKSSVENHIKNPKTPKPSTIKETNLKENKTNVKSHRYVLLDKKRGVENLDNKTIENITKKEMSIDKTELAINNYGDMNILEIEEEQEVCDSSKNKAESDRITCNGVELEREKLDLSNGYVYDIYYAKNQEIHLDLLYPNNFTINSFDLDLRPENIQGEPEEFYEDDEDSNDEGNWRNDYPDEDDQDNIDDENDEDGIGRHGYMGYTDTGDDYYNEYNEEDDNKLSAILKKTCNLDGSYYEDDENSDDLDEEYNGEDSKSYSAFKKKLIRDLDK